MLKSLFGTFSLPLPRVVLPVKAEEEQEEDTTPAAAPPPSQPSKNAPPSLDSLSPEELEDLKQELVNEVIDKIAGPDNERLQDFLEPEIVTAPYDPRFPNRNQARHCFVRFNEFFKCAHERGEDHPRCVFYKRAYHSVCPQDWIDNWMELRENGLWTGKY